MAITNGFNRIQRPQKIQRGYMTQHTIVSSVSYMIPTKEFLAKQSKIKTLDDNNATI